MGARPLERPAHLTIAMLASQTGWQGGAHPKRIGVATMQARAAHLLQVAAPKIGKSESRKSNEMEVVLVPPHHLPAHLPLVADSFFTSAAAGDAITLVLRCHLPVCGAASASPVVSQM